MKNGARQNNEPMLRTGKGVGAQPCLSDTIFFDYQVTKFVEDPNALYVYIKMWGCVGSSAIRQVWKMIMK